MPHPYATEAPPGGTTAEDTGWETWATAFGALSDPTRLAMLRRILEQGEVGCVEFENDFTLSKSTLSYHAKVLHRAGLIETRREGRFFFYRPAAGAFSRLYELVGRLGMVTGNHVDDASASRSSP